MTPERLREILHDARISDANYSHGMAPSEPEAYRALVHRNELLEYVEALTAERDMLKRGGKTLGEIVDRQCRDVIEATGSQDIIGEDGDGDWEIVWDRLHLMRAALADMTRQRDDARRIAIDAGAFQ